MSRFVDPRFSSRGGHSAGMTGGVAPSPPSHNPCDSEHREESHPDPSTTPSGFAQDDNIGNYSQVFL